MRQKRSMLSLSRLKFQFIWYDMWVGAYWDKRTRYLYLCLLPCLVIRYDFWIVAYGLCECEHFHAWDENVCDVLECSCVTWSAA